MLMFQHLNQDGENLGGLFVRADSIAAVYAVSLGGQNGEKFSSNILLNCGTPFRVAQPVAEVLDMLRDNSTWGTPSE